MGKLIIFLGILMITAYALSPWQTEIACYDLNGELVFYESGYKPNTKHYPVQHRGVDSNRNNIYIVKSTKEMFKGSCKSHWGGTVQGKEYYQ